LSILPIMLSAQGGRARRNIRQLPPNAPPTLNFTSEACLARTLLTATSPGVVLGAGEECNEKNRGHHQAVQAG
jgi:hypothetical protein